LKNRNDKENEEIADTWPVFWIERLVLMEPMLHIKKAKKKTLRKYQKCNFLRILKGYWNIIMCFLLQEKSNASVHRMSKLHQKLKVGEYIYFNSCWKCILENLSHKKKSLARFIIKPWLKKKKKFYVVNMVMIICLAPKLINIRIKH
jgi:hypothetical protein